MPAITPFIVPAYFVIAAPTAEAADDLASAAADSYNITRRDSPTRNVIYLDEVIPTTPWPVKQEEPHSAIEILPQPYNAAPELLAALRWVLPSLVTADADVEYGFGSEIDHVRKAIVAAAGPEKTKTFHGTPLGDVTATLIHADSTQKIVELAFPGETSGYFIGRADRDWNFHHHAQQGGTSDLMNAIDADFSPHDFWPTLDPILAEIAETNGTARPAPEAATPSLQRNGPSDPPEPVGGHCPVCNSTEIHIGAVEIDSGTATQHIACEQCDADWTNTYLFDHSTLHGN